MQIQSKEVTIVMRDPRELKRYGNNPRHNDAAVQAIAASIRTYGFINPIVIDTKDVIIAGDTRLQAALQEGLQAVPCISAGHLTPDKVKAYRIADNKTAEIAEWDQDALCAELEELQKIGFDLADTGFSSHEIERLFEELETAVTENTSGEIDLDDYEDDQYEHKCPRCGLLYN